MKKMLKSAILGSAMAMSATASFASGHESGITVAYFLEWPMPFQYAKVNGEYEKALGVDVNWVSFDTGTAMSAAMASGDVHIAVSQGMPPFVVAASAGQDLQTLDIAVSYAENDNCVVRSDLEIDKTSAKELEGKKVAVPLGTAAHYGFLAQMSHFEVDISTLEVVDMAPAEGAAAIAQSQVDMACGFGGGLRRMQEHGNVLLTGAEKEALGILVFDVTSAPTSFVTDHPDMVEKFLKVTADANAKWNSGNYTEEMLPVIAKDSGMDLDSAAKSIATFVFPSPKDQVSDAWLGSAVPAFMKGVADVFVEAGSIPSALDGYTSAVNTAPLNAVAAH